MTQAELDAGAPHGQRGDGDRHRGDPGQRRRDGDGGAEQVLNIVKDATIADVKANSTGDTITYTYTVTNTGNAAIAGVVVTDDNLTPGNG